MQFTGKVKAVLPQVTGSGNNGDWVKQPFVIEVQDGNFANMVAIDAWGDQASVVASLPLESEVTASVNIKSREYGGKWYTEIKAWKIEVKSSIKAPQGYATQPPTAQPQVGSSQLVNDSDLPF
jgi:Domain of unknown function (DUF3127)